ncbi:hypothetical protein BDZ89DRAFT_30493 [Hymenopellis radicata]|nr:hypothetical protein BDZ89DRAFT_30493 [Hymenopellis radicata]
MRNAVLNRKSFSCLCHYRWRALDFSGQNRHTNLSSEYYLPRLSGNRRLPTMKIVTRLSRAVLWLSTTCWTAEAGTKKTLKPRQIRRASPGL